MRDVHLQCYGRSIVEHYRFADVRFADIEGDEDYAGAAGQHREARPRQVQRLRSPTSRCGARPDEVAAERSEPRRTHRRRGAGRFPSPTAARRPRSQPADHELLAGGGLTDPQAHDVGG